MINPYLAVLAGVLAVSFSAVFVRLSEAPALMIATYRLLFTFLLLAPFTLAKYYRELTQLSLKQVALACMSGIFLALHFATWFVSLNYTSVASSVVLVTTQPIFVVIGSYLFFHEKVSTKALWGGALALLGSIYIGATDFQVGGQALFGDFLALTAAILVSGYLIIGRKLRAEISLSSYTFCTYGASSLTLIIASYLTHTPFGPYPLHEWALFGALAVVCTIGGHTVFNWALKYVQASVVAVSILGEPLGAILWASLFLHETPTLRQSLGGLIILLGLFVFTRYANKK